VGSGQSVAGPLVVLNTILADSLEWISDELDAQLAAGQPLEEAAFAVLRRTMEAHGAVVFGGDGYSTQWHRMAVEERGLENLRTTADALPVLTRPEITALFERQAVLSPVELHSRFEVYSEQYILAVEVEARLVLRIARTQIQPAVTVYLERLIHSLRDQEFLGLAGDRSLASQVAERSQALMGHCSRLQVALEGAPDDGQAHRQHCAETLLPLMTQIREVVDSLETLVDDGLWPLPTYEEMLFMR
jgi:glutamine synthetase